MSEEDTFKNMDNINIDNTPFYKKRVFLIAAAAGLIIIAIIIIVAAIVVMEKIVQTVERIVKKIVVL